MRQVTFKTNDEQKIEFTTNLTSFILDQEQPYGIGYNLPCSSTLTEVEIVNWWIYVDELLNENPTPNFQSVWKIVDNGVIYGYEN
jgi:hypothetical protein